MRITHRSPSLARPTPSEAHRPSFTLVEMLVVIGIIALLAALAVLILPSLQNNQRVASGADVVQGQLFIAKQMALRDQQSRGVRLIAGNNGFTSLQLIEQPAPFTNGAVFGVGAQDPNTGWWPVQFGIDPLSGSAPSFGGGAVQPGDLLDLSAAGDSYC